MVLPKLDFNHSFFLLLFFGDFLANEMSMDEDLIRQILAAQGDVESAPTAEMMMMNSSTMNGIDSMDSELINALQQQPTVRVNSSMVRSTRTTAAADDDDDDLLLEDETFLERIVALKEMFPERVQNAVGTINRTVINTSKLAFSKGRTAAWW